MKRILLFGLLGLITWFIFQNQGYLGRPVELVFFSFRQTLMLGFWLILSFSAGSLLFMLVDLPKSFALKRELTRKSQELARVQFELTRVQAQIQQTQAPIPGNPSQAAPQAPYIPPLQANPRDMEDRLGL